MPIRMNQNYVFNLNQSGSIQTRTSPNYIFNHNQSESFRPRMHFDWFEYNIFGLNRNKLDYFSSVFNRTGFTTFSGLNRNETV